ncbi:MAG: vitamin K epoxide reductase family protein [Chlamydiae bacterium]|nr:vitamin K epoxide reductase family protein [Chlamydiota bacterium]
MKASFLLSALGFWLLVLPITLGYPQGCLYGSDVLSGGALFIFGVLGFWKEQRRWFILSGLVGIWLQLAPLVFWATHPIMYLNDTIVGILVVSLSAFLMGFWEEEEEEYGERVPLGWSFNPSDFGPRLVTASLAMVCWFLARYMAFYQLGYTHHVEDPFFGDGTVRVITSQISKLFPVSDAGLGAFVYTLEFLLAWMGGRHRWKSMPWLSVFFGVMVVPAGMTSVLLIVSQPIFVGAWCGLCLLIAICMLAMIVLTIPEVAASLQLLYRVKKRGWGFWYVFWHGDSTRDPVTYEVPAGRTKTSSMGFTFPLNLVVSVLIGAWLMCSPVVLDIPHPASNVAYLIGPLVVAFTVVALSEVTRGVRFVNVLLGLALLLTPWFVEGFSSLAILHNILIGFLLIFLCLKRGIIRESYGSRIRKK